MEAPWQEIKRQVMDGLDMSREFTDEELRERIALAVRGYSKEKLLSLKVRESYEEQIFNSFRRLDVLQELLDDPEVTEIMVNGEAHIFYEKEGALFPWTKAELSRERLGDMIQQIAGSANRAVNEANPILDTRLSDGSRVNIVLEPVSVEGSVSIRKFSKKPMTLERMMERDSLSGEVAEFLELLVQAGYNIFISGGNRLRKNDIFECIICLYSKDRSGDHNRRFGRTSVPGCGESGAAGNKRGQSGIRNRNYDTRSDPRSFAYASESRNYRRSARSGNV